MGLMCTDCAALQLPDYTPIITQQQMLQRSSLMSFPSGPKLVPVMNVNITPSQAPVIQHLNRYISNGLTHNIYT